MFYCLLQFNYTCDLEKVEDKTLNYVIYNPYNISKLYTDFTIRVF